MDALEFLTSDDFSPVIAERNVGAVSNPTETAMRFYMDKGYSRAQAAGIVGNLLHESNLNHNAKGDGGASYGLAQWNGDRRKGLFDYAKTKKESTPGFITQLEYIDRELNGEEGPAGQALKNAQTPEGAAWAFSELYERPGKPVMQNRIRNAKALFGTPQDGGILSSIGKIIGPSEAEAAEPPQKQKSAMDFLAAEDAGTKPSSSSAIDFLNAPDEPGMLSNLGTGAKKALGIATGIANAPHAFVAGAARAANENPEEFNKLPWWEQNLVGLGGGFQSAYESAFKEGSYGAGFNDIWKFYTGKTVEDSLGPDAKKYAPTLEFVGSILTDPFVTIGGWSDIVRHMGRKEIMGGLTKQLPESVIRMYENAWGTKAPGMAEIEAMDKHIADMAANDRSELIGQLAGILEKKKQAQLQPEFKQFLAEQRLALPEGRNFELVPPEARKSQSQLREELFGFGSYSPPVSRMPDVDIAARERQLPPEVQRIADMAAEAKTRRQEALRNVLPPEIADKILPVERELPFEPAMGQAAGQQRVNDIINRIRESREARIGESARQVGEVPTRPGVEAGSDYAARVAGAIEAEKPTQFRAVAGGVSGVDQDEEGNITFDPMKAAAGFAAATAAKSTIDNTKLNSILSKSQNYQRVASMIGKVGKDTPSYSEIGKILDEKLLDRFTRLKDVSPETYEQARKFNSYKDVANIELDTLRQELKPVAGNQDLFSKYITAKRAETRANMLKTSETKPGVAGAVKMEQAGQKPTWVWQVKNPQDVTASEARGAIQEIENAYKQAGGDPRNIQKAADSFNEFTQNTMLTPLKDSGIISEKAYQQILKDNDFYAAFNVIDHLPPDASKIPSNLASKEYFSVANQDIIKGLKGTEKQITDPVEATVKKFLQTKTIIARNDVASTFVEDMLTSPQSGISDLIRPIATSGKEASILKKQGLNPIMEGAFSEREYGTIARFNNGKVEKYAVPIDLAETMKQLTPQQANKVVQGINAVFRATATTLYLPFTIGNAMRDAFMAYTTSPVYKWSDMFGKYQLDWIKGLTQGGKYELGVGKSTVPDYLKAGGGMGYTGQINRTDRAVNFLFEKSFPGKVLDIVKSPITLIDKISGAVELAPRMAVYERALKQGRSAEDAAMLAREATIDFNKAGTYTRMLNQWVPFLNARVQGRMQLASAIKNRSKETLAKVFAGTVAPGLALYAYNRTYYPELLDEIPDYVKKNYFTFITGIDKDKYGRTTPKYFVLAKGDIGQMAMNPVEYLLDQFYGKEPQKLTGFLVDTILSDLSPIDMAREGSPSGYKMIGGLLPPVAKGAVEDFANRNFFTGNEIVPSYMKDKPAALQFRDETPGTYKALSEKLADMGVNISPLRMQNLGGSLFAGYGREGLDPESMLKGLTGRLQKTKGGASEQKAWDIINQVTEEYKHTQARAADFTERGDTGKAISLVADWNENINGKIAQLEKLGFPDQGGLIRSMLFTPRKIKNILRGKTEETAPIEQRLSPKRTR